MGVSEGAGRGPKVIHHYLRFILSYLVAAPKDCGSRLVVQQARREKRGGNRSVAFENGVFMLRMHAPLSNATWVLTSFSFEPFSATN